MESPIAHTLPIAKKLIRRVEKGGPDEGPVEGEAVDSAPMVAVPGEGTKRVLNFEVRRWSWTVGMVVETSGVVFGVVVVNDKVDDVESRDAVDMLIADEAKVVCATSEVGMKNATWEVGATGATACTLAPAAEETGDGSAAVLDIGGGGTVSVVGTTDAVRVGFDFDLSDWAAGAG